MLGSEAQPGNKKCSTLPSTLEENLYKMEKYLSKKLKSNQETFGTSLADLALQ